MEWYRRVYFLQFSLSFWNFIKSFINMRTFWRISLSINFWFLELVSLYYQKTFRHSCLPLPEIDMLRWCTTWNDLCRGCFQLWLETGDWIGGCFTVTISLNFHSMFGYTCSGRTALITVRNSYGCKRYVNCLEWEMWKLQHLPSLSLWMINDMNHN